MVLGIVSIAGSFLCFGFIGLLPGVVGLILAIVCLSQKKEPRGKAKAGLITSIIGLAMGIIVTIIAVVILFSSGLFLGLVSSLADDFDDTDPASNINVIDNTSAYNNGFDLDNDNDDIDADELEDLWGKIDPDGNYDLNVDDDGDVIINKNDGFVMGRTTFDDLEKYGYTYEYGDDTYRVYTNEYGSQFEFPAYVYEYTQFGDDEFGAYNNYIGKMGIPENEDYYYDRELYQYNSEWDYALAEQISQYDDWEEYELFMFAFSKYSDDMVILVCRPSESQTFDDCVDEFEDLLSYMTCQ